MKYSTLTLSTYSRCLIITLHRPDKLNALNRTMLDELHSIFINKDLLSTHHSIVITGSGKAFAAGADISELSQCNGVTGTDFSRYGQHVFQQIESCTRPVIAAINGYALGGGCELAIACHLRFASKTAVLGQPEIKLGIIPGYGGTQRLARLIGISRAIELIITCEHISAQRAYEIGLVNRLYEPEELLDQTLRFCASIEGLPICAIESALACVQNSRYDNFELEAAHFGRLCGSADFREGTSAFLEKRQPHFTGQ